MRCDPDVIMIGEIRWPAAAAAALDAALTGHAVWTTVHAADAFAIARRLTGMLTSAGVPDPRETLFGQGVCAGLICQRLMSLNCPPLQPAALLPYRGSTAQPPSRRT